MIQHLHKQIPFPQEIKGYAIPPKQAVLILDNNTPAIDDPILIDVKAVTTHDGNEVCGQFNNGADTTVTDLLVYRQFKRPASLTGAVGSKFIYPLGQGKLGVPAAVNSGYSAIHCFYSPNLSSTLFIPRNILKTTTRCNKDFSGQDMKSPKVIGTSATAF